VTRARASSSAEASLGSRYRLLGRIATGGFGTVYRAEDSVDDRLVAVKMLHPELVSSPAVVARFEREVRTVNLIRHPNVVEIYDFGEAASGRPYFVMELLAGATLRDHVATHGRMTASETVEILAPLCRALDAAHAKGVVHRDLKPSNVFLRNVEDTPAADPGRRVVLLDFGVCKLLEDTARNITSSRHMIGTPPCMAPEQITGDPVDPRTDVYSLGVLVYHLLTGRLPFVHMQAGVIREMHLRAPPPLPSLRAPVSGAIDDVVVRAMAKLPADRFDGAGAVLAALRSAVGAPGGRSPAPCSGHGIALRIEASLAAPFEELDDETLARFEDILPRLSQPLVALGLRIVIEGSDSMLLVGALPEDPRRERADREDILAAAAAAHRQIVAELADAPVRFGIRGQVGLVDDLLRPGAWQAAPPLAGVVGPEALFAGLDLVVEPAGDGGLRLVTVPDSEAATESTPGDPALSTR
jgi:serine/threonine-protein kinase